MMIRLHLCYDGRLRFCVADRATGEPLFVPCRIRAWRSSTYHRARELML